VKVNLAILEGKTKVAGVRYIAIITNPETQMSKIFGSGNLVALNTHLGHDAIPTSKWSEIDNALHEDGAWQGDMEIGQFNFTQIWHNTPVLS
jgi:hypothetical protein